MMIKKNMKTLSYVLCLTVFTAASHAYECRDTIDPTTPSEYFLVNRDGTVTDMRFGLTWQVCTFGQQWDQSTSSCKGEPKKVQTWSDAILSQDVINGEKSNGHSDWRLPSIKELRSIIENKCRQPAVNLDIFKSTMNGVYWSHTPDGQVNPDLPGRIIDFSDGVETNRAVSPEKFVRHVRSIN